MSSRPTIRLNISSSSGSGGGSSSSSNFHSGNNSNNNNNKNKRQKVSSSGNNSYSINIHQQQQQQQQTKSVDRTKANASNLCIWHQRTCLSFAYNNNNCNDKNNWAYEGVTTLYVTTPAFHPSEKDNNNNKKKKNNNQQDYFDLGFHLRGSNTKVKSVQAYSVQLSPSTNKNKSGGGSKKNKSSTTTHLDGKRNYHHPVSPDHHMDIDDKDNNQDSRKSKYFNATFKPLIIQEEEGEEEEEMAESTFFTDPLSKVFHRPITLMEHDLLGGLDNNNKEGKKNKIIYEGDSYCYDKSGGAKRVMSHLRLKGAASLLGELRVRIPSSSFNNITLQTKNNDTTANASTIDKGNNSDLLLSTFLTNYNQEKEEGSRLSIEQTIQDFWMQDLSLTSPSSSNEIQREGMISQRLRQRAFNDSNTQLRKLKRLSYVSQQLAKYSLLPYDYHYSQQRHPTKNNNKNRKKENTTSYHHQNASPPTALKIVIHFKIDLPIQNTNSSSSSSSSLGGIHFTTPSLNTLSSGIGHAPYVYTTTGTMGDHQGPRFWIPCLDSASQSHRCSHELSIKVTSQKKEGLSIVGCGENFGWNETFIHSAHDSLLVSSSTSEDDNDGVEEDENQMQDQRAEEEDVRSPMYIKIERECGKRHTNFIQNHFLNRRRRRRVVNDDGLLATVSFSTFIFTPIPIRSLGFAIGPFIYSPDPEYYQDIRQVYLAPKSQRPFLHDSRGDDYNGDDIIDGTGSNNGLHSSVTAGTSGIPLRALSLTKEILQLPSFRSSTYTQVWLPNCVGGGSSSGLLSTISGYDLNCWIGGATLDSLLLPPPPNFKLPYHAGGRYLQMIQAKSAIMGWIVSSLSLGSLNSYNHQVIQNYHHDSAQNSQNKQKHPQKTEPAAASTTTSTTASASESNIFTSLDELMTNYQDVDCDDVGQGYIPYGLFCALLMDIYERAHGGSGEGGSKSSHFFVDRFAVQAGLNGCGYLDFLPLKNVEEEEIEMMGLDGSGGSSGGVEHVVGVEKKNEELWRGTLNGTESRTSTKDECAIRKVFASDILHFLERIDEEVSLPSPDWQGSHLSLTFLSSFMSFLSHHHHSNNEPSSSNTNMSSNRDKSHEKNSKGGISSSSLGCGVTDFLHPIGGLSYRAIKAELLSQSIASRAGLENFIRVIRACFLATMLMDDGKTSLPDLNALVQNHLNEISNNEEENKEKAEVKEKESKKKSKRDEKKGKDEGSVSSKTNNNNNINQQNQQQEIQNPTIRPSFVICVDEIIKRGGITHSLLTTCLRRLAGPIREPYLHPYSPWSLIDISRDIKDANNRSIVQPEGYPNSFTKGCSSLFLRCGVHVEPIGGDHSGHGSNPNNPLNSLRGIHLHLYSEPIIPRGGIAFEGPITIRVIENEGQCCEFDKNLSGDGRREYWGAFTLHANPVTTMKQQNAASGVIETGSDTKNLSGAKGGGGTGRKGCFNSNLLHSGGYQMLEVIRLTNRTPLLWVRVDPHNHYPGAQIHVSQPDACLAEQLFHDGDAAGQLIALRSLAERPTRIQGSVKISSIYDVSVNEMPVRILGDCLRGSVALHCSLAHTPAVRAQAALAIAQWQNNKAPMSKDAVGEDSWLGLHILLQYFKERHMKNGVVLPVKYTRLSIKKPGSASSSRGKHNNTDKQQTTSAASDNYVYLDMIGEDDRDEELAKAEDIAEEEDEEYRVRSAVITAIASIRAKDGQTPPIVLRFLESILSSGALENDASIKDNVINKRFHRSSSEQKNEIDDEAILSEDEEEDLAMMIEHKILPQSYVTSHVVADTLLALCHINSRPIAMMIDDHDHQDNHPVLPFMESCHRWLEWELYKENVRMKNEQKNMTGIGGGCYSCVAVCAITALSHLAILRNCTTHAKQSMGMVEGNSNNLLSHNHDNVAVVVEEDDNTAFNTKQRKKSLEASSAKFYIDIFDSEPRRSDPIRAAAAQAIVCVCCAADRLKKKRSETLGLLTALEFLLERIIDPTLSSGLRHTLAALMMDACTFKVCSMQRVATIAGRNDFFPSVSRFMCGPLGASAGGDNGSALLMNPHETSYPAAYAVNRGAREGMRVLGNTTAAHYSKGTIIRVARFASKLWRTINGENVTKKNDIEIPYSDYADADGVCAYDGSLRIALLSLWQKIWPNRECPAINQVKLWRDTEKNTSHSIYDNIIYTSPEEFNKIQKDSSNINNSMGMELILNKIVNTEIDRQRWRGQMAKKAYDIWQVDGKKRGGTKDSSSSTAFAQGLGYPLPICEKNKAWRMGGWASSAAQQRRKMALDGGTTSVGSPSITNTNKMRSR